MCDHVSRIVNYPLYSVSCVWRYNNIEVLNLQQVTCTRRNTSSDTKSGGNVKTQKQNNYNETTHVRNS